MENIIQFWKNIGQFQILENNLHDITICGLIILFGIFFKRYISVIAIRLIYSAVKKASKKVPVIELVNLLKAPIGFFFSIILIYTACSFLHYPDVWHLVSVSKFGLKMIISRIYGVLTFISIVWIIYRVIDFFALVLRITALESENKLQEQLAPFLKQVVKLIISILFFFIMLGVVFNLNVGAIITGLGIGGVAVALAGKETLENLFASFSIFIDKPFVAGDLIKIANITGNVETVGFRTTRIRTADKSLVTIPNKQLIDQPLENLSYRDPHRAKLAITLPNNTTLEAVKLVIEKIKQEIMGDSLLNKQPPIVYLDGFGSNTLEILIIFYSTTIDADDAWKVKENINFCIVKVMEEAGIRLECPISMVYQKKE